MFNFTEGEVLLIDKPYKWSSFDAVKKIRGAIGIKKIGHAGTLDPLATGLLILCTGKKTKQIDLFQGWEKEYEGEMLLGKTTPSIDLETDFDKEFPIDHITEADIRTAAINFLGTTEQLPPIYSAIKINGQRAYKKARKGQEAEIKPRQIFIKEFVLTSVNLPYIKFRLTCSKGTYVRSLVRDLGEYLNNGACLTALRRTRIGKYRVNEAKSPVETIEIIRNAGIQEHSGI